MWLKSVTSHINPECVCVSDRRQRLGEPQHVVQLQWDLHQLLWHQALSSSRRWREQASCGSPLCSTVCVTFLSGCIIFPSVVTIMHSHHDLIGQFVDFTVVQLYRYRVEKTHQRQTRHKAIFLLHLSSRYIFYDSNVVDVWMGQRDWSELMHLLELTLNPVKHHLSQIKSRSLHLLTRQKPTCINWRNGFHPNTFCPLTFSFSICLFICMRQRSRSIFSF